MRRWITTAVLGAALLVIATSASAVEQLTLTTPVTKTANTGWRLDVFEINRSASTVRMVFLDPGTGETKDCTQTGPAAITLMKTLNTVNLTTNSLEKRAITNAQSTGCLGAGSVTGTPDVP